MFVIIVTRPLAVTKKPVLVSSELEMSVMKNKIAELKAQMNSQSSRDRDRAISASGEGFNIVSMLSTTENMRDASCETCSSQSSLWLLAIRLYSSWSS